MTVDQIDNTVRKHLERVDEAVFALLADADRNTLNAIKEDNPFWLTLMNIDIDFHLDNLED